MHLIRSRGLIALGLAAALTLVVVSTAFAGGPGESPTSAQIENQVCLSCHANPDLAVKLPSGETLKLYTDGNMFNQSVHGKQGQRCTACHADISGYPHPPLAVKTVRDYSIQMYTSCGLSLCHKHTELYEQNLDSIHSTELRVHNFNAAICTDCHTAHYVMNPNEPRSRIPQTCQKCHSTIYDQYKASVHGAALLDQSNPDVPTCIDCHGVHGKIADPTTNKFRMYSPELCAKCHSNNAMMKKYNISTNVFNTYVADFHGTTVELFEKQSPDAPTNKPVCYDCHGVHNIKNTQDPKSTVFKDNLLKTCQQCHPDAAGTFPDSWVSHYDASPTKYPLVYYINLFYTVLIPVTLGGMGAFIALDILRRILNRIHGHGS